MRKQKIANLKAADLTVFYDEKDPQQYLVYDLNQGETVIGSSSEKSQLVLRFAAEINDAHAKISIEGEDYSIEDLGSQKGTFKIKSDDSLIRLKPFKSYDLSPQMAFYLGRFKCVFRAVKSGRAAGLFSLSPLDGNSQKGKNQVQRQMSLEDDIEEDEGSRRSKKSLQQKLSKNQRESELIDDEVERKAVVSKLVINKQNRLVEQYHNLQSQKKFVKSKGQLPKVEAEEQSKDKESITLNKSFLERIQERLKNQQKDAISDIGNNNNSEKKKNQEIKSIGKEGRKVNPMEEEEEEIWTPLKMKTQKKESEESEKKKKKQIKVEDKNLSKIDKIIDDIISKNVDQKTIKVKEQIKEDKGLTKKKVEKNIEAEGADDLDKIKEINGTAKGKGQTGANKRNIDKQTLEEKAEKGLSKKVSEKKKGSNKQEKEVEEIKEVKSKMRGKIDKKEEKMIDTKKSAAVKKVIQKEEQKEVTQKKGKSKKEQKIVVEDTEEEMVLEKKSTSVAKSKKAASKSEAIDEEIPPKKSVGKQKLEKIEASKEITKASSSKKKNAAADVKANTKEDKTSKKEKALLGKRKAAQNDIEEDNIPKKKVKKQEENEQEGKAKSDTKKDQKKDKDNKKNAQGSTSSAAKRELAQLNREGNVILDSGSRRDKLRVLFSNSCVNDTEKEQLSQLGVQIVNDLRSVSDFDILVTDQISRRVKILVAINKGIPIVESAWVKKSIKQNDALPFEPFVITKAGKELFNQYSFTFSESRMRQLEHPQGVLHGVEFALPYPLGNITHIEYYNLIQSAGATGTFLQGKKTYTVTESSRTEQNKELLKLGHKLVSEEGILQSCLLQQNVLDDYLIKKEPTTFNKKTAKK